MSTCVEWTAAKTTAGYGLFSVGRSLRYAHRAMWVGAFGPIPKGASVLHKCDNPACIRPSHLFLGTQGDNMRDMVRKGRYYKPSRKRECPQGHPYKGDNILINTYGYQTCRTCRYAQARAWRAKRKREFENSR